MLMRILHFQLMKLDTRSASAFPLPIQIGKSGTDTRAPTLSDPTPRGGSTYGDGDHVAEFKRHSSAFQPGRARKDDRPQRPEGQTESSCSPLEGYSARGWHIGTQICSTARHAPRPWPNQPAIWSPSQAAWHRSFRLRETSLNTSQFPPRASLARTLVNYMPTKSPAWHAHPV